MNKYEEAAEEKWGAFRKFIAAHPLTGFWVGVVAGVVVGGLLRGIL